MRRLLIPAFLATLISCSGRQENVEVRFDLQFDGQPITCDTETAPVRLTDLRFYVQNLRFVTAEQQELPLNLVADGLWQNDRVALLDFENGEGACLNGSAETNRIVRGSYSGGPISSLEFDIGVPAELNHADPLRAAPPLAYTEMHWHWASGYKFMRAGIETDNDSFFLHLGSSRCEGTIGDIRGCAAANRPTVLLPDFNPNMHTVVLNLEKLIGAVNLWDGVRTDCMSGPTNEACRGPFAELGIEFESGISIDAASVFKVGLRE